MRDPYLSVVVPCYNESENLRRGVLDEMHAYLCRQDYAYEVVVSDDGSTDDSLALVRDSIAAKPAFRLVENAHGGKPSAVWGGIQAARGEIVLFTDMDQSTPIDQVARLLPRFAEGSDVVIGSRGYGRRDFPLYRRLGSAIFRAFRRLLLLHEGQPAAVLARRGGVGRLVARADDDADLFDAGAQRLLDDDAEDRLFRAVAVDEGLQR